jgi:PST family polysaccharide transporter
MQAVGYVLPLVTVPYLLRVLGPEHFCLIAFAQAVMAYFITLNDYGFNLSSTRELAIRRDDRRLKSELYFSVMAFKAVLCFVSLLSRTVLMHPKTVETPLANQPVVTGISIPCASKG